MMQKSFYPVLSRFWGWVFVVVGLTFVVAPNHVSLWLVKISYFLGVPLVIQGPATNLWYVLALSLMAAVSACAFLSARYPEERGVYVVLILAKLTSTLGFFYFAVWYGPLWLLCAFADGFVALTLVAARRNFRFALLAPHPLKLVFRGQKPFYEVYFGRVLLESGSVFWFRHTLRQGITNEVAFWSVHFDPKNNIIESDKRILPAACLDENLLKQWGFPILAHGRFLGTTIKAHWDLQSKISEHFFSPVPLSLRLLGLARSVYWSAAVDGRVSGIIQRDDTSFSVNDAKGMWGHFSGKGHAHDWFWVHANQFEDSSLAFEGLAVRTPFLGKVRGPISWFVLKIEERFYEFHSLNLFQKITQQEIPGGWSFQIKSRRFVIEGQAIFGSDNMVATLSYEDPDGSKLTCRNSGVATLELHIHDQKTKKEYHSKAVRTAMLERVTPST